MNGSNQPAVPQQPLTARMFPQRLGIFVDVQNMFYSAKMLHQSKVDYGKLLREITGNRHLIRAIAYIVQKPDVNQAGFHEALSRFGYELKIKEMKIRPDPDGRTSSIAKGSWEIGLTIDALSMAPKFDCVTLVTGDGDYAPLVECLKMHGCRVEIVSFERSTAGELVKAADQYIPIPDSCIFKEKKFEGGTSSAGLLGAPTNGGPYDGLPRYDYYDSEDSTPSSSLVQHFDDDLQPPNVHHNGTARNKDRSSKVSPDLSIVA
ncbi:MAG: NYN domain-containing protein [Planctomycetota bacterium]